MPHQMAPSRKLLISKVRHASDLMDKREYEEARRLLYEVRKALASENRVSSHVEWWIAICSDYLAEPEPALTHAARAVSIDPLSLPMLHSYDVICDRLRATLDDDEIDPDDPRRAEYYALLSRYGEADERSHLTMVRFHAASGDREKAIALLRALELLQPNSPEVRACRAELEKQWGGDALGPAPAELALTTPVPVHNPVLD